MTSGPGEFPWHTVQASVTGLRKPRNQDAAVLYPVPGGAVVMAVADGHGSAAHFRSDLGSRWAVRAFVDAAVPVAREALRVGPDPALWRGLRGTARQLPQDVVRRWREYAMLHECNAPAHGSPPSPGRPMDLTAYGSTLIGAVVTPHLMLFWQLGDGDVVLVGPDGTAEAPFYSGPEFGDETDSLCLDEAWRRMEMRWQPLLERSRRPAVFLSTDGLSKSYADHNDFLSFATGIHARGIEEVRTHLGDWLGSAAAHSGDDTTFVGLFPVDADGRRPADRD